MADQEGEMRRTISAAVLPLVARVLLSSFYGLAHAQCSPTRETGLVGAWRSAIGNVRFDADGTLVVSGEAFCYTAEGGRLTLIASDGVLPLPYRLEGDSLSVSIGPQTLLFTRVPAAGPGQGGAGGVLPELVGRWCYISVTSTGTVSGSTDECIAFNADGTYQYGREFSSSGPAGSVASQESDSGSWTATQATITFNSRIQGTFTLDVERRNHPRNNDPMLCVGNTCFVTYYQRPPWP